MRRGFFLVAVLLGGPFYLLSGQADPTTALILGVAFVGALVLVWSMIRKAAAERAQEDFWLRQRR